jgi:DNA polymerase elongation subunit (family B)
MITFASWESYRASTSQESRRNGSILGPSSLVAQFLVRSGLTLFKGMAYPDLRRMQLDLETLGLDPSDPDAAIIMISIRQGSFEDVLVLESTEAELIERFNAVITRLDPDIIEGHNIFRFDLPYLVERARRAGVPLMLGRDRSAPRIVDRDQQVRVGPMSQSYAAAFIHGRHVIDTYLQIQRFDVQGQFSRYGLKDVIRQMGLERSDRIFVDRTTISDMWRRGDRDRDTLAQYALDDVRDVDMLSRVILPTEFYQTQILPITYQRAAVTGTGKKIDDLMIRTYLSAMHSLPRAQRPRPYPGGYVELIASGVFGPVVKCDVESLYPSIMLSQGIAAQTDSLGAFPLLLRDLTNRRIDAKRRVRQSEGEEQAIWDGLQGSFKILINSFYGYLGFGGGIFNDFDAAEQVTLAGQAVIKDVVQQLRHLSAEPIEVDTDGVYFSPPDAIRTSEDEERFVEHIGDLLPAGIRLAHDGRFRHMLSLKQKTYALIDYDDTLIMKGSALRSRALERCFQHFLRDAARAFMEADQDAVRDLYFALAEALQSKSLPVHDISQWTMLRQDKIASRTRLKALLDATPGRWRYGERIEMYEREDGALGLAEDYDNDENTTALLKRLRDVAERFEMLFEDRAAFDATFPLIRVTTDLVVARQRVPMRQLGLL